MRRLLMLIPVIAALAVPAAAAAFEPTRETVQLANRLTSTCPNGDVLVSVFDVTREITTFYDSEGRPVRQLWIATFQGTTTNVSTGVSVPNIGLRVFQRDLVNGGGFSTGPNVITQLTGGGVAILGAGRLVFDAQGRLIEHNGRDTNRELAELCAAVAG
jgi:hypothetical protein